MLASSLRGFGCVTLQAIGTPLLFCLGYLCGTGKQVQSGRKSVKRQQRKAMRSLLICSFILIFDHINFNSPKPDISIAIHFVDRGHK